MSKKAVLIFSVWTSAWSVIFYHFYNTYVSFGIPWVMFVCMAVFFGMGMRRRQSWECIMSAFCGMRWGQIDFLLMAFLKKQSCLWHGAIFYMCL